jgi:TPR repeat protein
LAAEKRARQGIIRVLTPVCDLGHSFLCALDHNALLRGGENVALAMTGRRPHRGRQFFPTGDAVMKNPRSIVLLASLFVAGASATAQAGDAGPSETASAYYRAAVQGSADAQARLGELFALGNGVEQSDAASIQWFMRAAEQGHAASQLKLAEIWSSGLGVARNDALAYRWAWLAKANAADVDTRDRAGTLLGTLATQLSQDQIAEALRWAAQWKPQREVVPAVAEPADKTARPARRAASGHQYHLASQSRPAQTSQSRPAHRRGPMSLFALARKLGW